MTDGERARLQGLVDRYVQHLPWCQMLQPSNLMAGDGPNRCQCGLAKAIAACLAAEGEAGNPLQSELLDLIKLMPDAQVDEILSFVATLREARRLATETRSGDIGRAESAPPSGEIKPEAR